MFAPRHLPRLAATIGLFTRYGLAEFAREQGLSALGKLEVPQLNVLVEGLQKVANRVFSGLVLAGLIVASAMLLPHRRRALGTTGFLIAGALGLYMVGSILWKDRRVSKPRSN